MKKTVDLTKEDIKTVEGYMKDNNLKNFSEAIRDIIRNVVPHFAPFSAGNVKK
jgi:metal-responsive CopG/Arc/MetJ family transcriptional regulator